jgi:hypothetical protein
MSAAAAAARCLHSQALQESAHAACRLAACQLGRPASPQLHLRCQAAA